MNPVVEGEHSGYLIARDGPDRLRGLPYVASPDSPAVLGDVGKNPARIAENHPHHVEDMRAKNHQVLSTGPLVLLPTRANFLHNADRAAAYQTANMADRGHCAHLVAHLQLDLIFFDGFDHGVGIRQVRGKRLFEHDVGAGLSGGRHHIAALLGPARPNAYQIGLFLSQHFAIVAVAARRAATLHGGLPSAASSGSRGSRSTAGSSVPTGEETVVDGARGGWPASRRPRSSSTS